jgi:hypothetical protein
MAPNLRILGGEKMVLLLVVGMFLSMAVGGLLTGYSVSANVKPFSTEQVVTRVVGIALLSGPLMAILITGSCNHAGR